MNLKLIFSTIFLALSLSAFSQTQLTQLQQAQNDLVTLNNMAKDTSFNLVNVIALASWTTYKIECLKDTSIICVDVFNTENSTEQLVKCKPENRNVKGWKETRSIYVTKEPKIDEYLIWLSNGLKK